MKKVLFSLLCIMVFASFSFAEDEQISSTGGVSAFPGDVSYINFAYVADNADRQTQIIKSGSDVHFFYGIHVGITQTYYRHYIITNTVGTLVSYHMFSSVMDGGTDQTWLYFAGPLPIGDYTFTYAAAGDVSGMAVTNQVRFSVR